MAKVRASLEKPFETRQSIDVVRSSLDDLLSTLKAKHALESASSKEPEEIKTLRESKVQE